MNIKLPNEIKTERLILKKHCLFLKCGRLPSEHIQLWVDSINDNLEWLDRFLPHWDKPCTFEGEEAFLNDLITEEKEIAYGIWNTKTNELMGSIGTFNFTKTEKKTSVEIGFMLFEKFAGKGYGPEALQAIESTLFKAGLDETFLIINEKNTRSRRCAEKIGYSYKDEEKICDSVRTRLIYRKRKENN